MMKRRYLLPSIAVLLLACGLVIAGCDSGGGGTKTTPPPDTNPFLGNWSGTYTVTISGTVDGEAVNETDSTDATLNFTSSKWTIAIEGQGTVTGDYTRTGNIATLNVDEEDFAMDIYTAAISGSTLTLTATSAFTNMLEEELESEDTSITIGGTFTK